MQIRYARSIAAVTVVVILAAGYRTWFDRADPSSEGSGKPAAAKSGRVVPITTAAARAEDFAIRRRTIGLLESPAIVVVKSRIESQVLQQHVRDGQVVKQGDVLFTLDDRELQAQIARDEAQRAKDNATLAQARAELDRKQELVDKRVSPQQQLDQAIAAYRAAEQTVEADEAILKTDRLKLGYATLTAPIAGRVGAVRVTPGNLVSINDPTGLVTITQIQPIRAAFTLAERDLGALRKASAASPVATVRVYTPGSDTPLATGKLDFVDASVDTASGTIAAKALFANEGLELWPGMFVDVEIDLDVRPDTVLIPAVAIQSGQKGPFVFVVKDGKTAEMRPIELVGIEGNLAALKGGVADGERVIVEGQMRLVTGTPVSEAPAEPKAPAAGSRATFPSTPATGASGQASKKSTRDVGATE